MGRSLAVAFFLFSQVCAANPLGIAGWPTPEFNEKAPSSWLASDPVLGRMICPSLTRLNLHKKESEPLILKSIHIERSSNVTWVLGLRTGIYWWSAKELDATDVAEFLKRNLNRLILEKNWSNPGFEIQTERESVKVIWKKEPEFGPYILNSAILWKERNTSDAIKFECVGRFIPTKTDHAIHLSPNPRYLMEAKTYSFENLDEFRKYKRSGFEFQMAEDQSIDLAKRKVLEKASCDCLVDLPLMSAVLWFENPNSTKELRKRMSSLFPREALRNIGTGSWSSIPSSAIPKNHPGYDTSLLAPAFSLSRMNERKPLLLGSLQEKMGLVEKVLSDNLLAGGFDVKFLSSEDPKIDGLITGIFVPWPEMDFYDSLHSKAKGNLFGARKTVHLELDKVLNLYRLSLTQQHPDFNALKSIHKHLYDLELLSVLMQHQACLEFKGLTKKKLSINVQDPDWFLDLLTQ